jgi:hypothetical protein
MSEDLAILRREVEAVGRVSAMVAIFHELFQFSDTEEDRLKIQDFLVKSEFRIIKERSWMK